VKAASLVLFLMAAAVIGGQYGENSWIAELFSHWILQYAGLSLILFIYFGRKKQARKAYMAAAICLFCGYKMMNAVGYRAPTVKIGKPAAQVRIFEMNVQGKSEALSNWLPLHAGSYDVVVLLETGGAYASMLEKLKGEFPYQVSRLENSPFGITILSRWNILAQNEFTAEGGFYPQFELTIQDPNENKFLLYAMHLPPPFAPQMAEAHEVILGELIEKLQQKKYPALVIGDLNMTSYSRHFDKLILLTGLRDSAGFSPWMNSWPSFALRSFSGFGIRIDHCLMSTTYSLVTRERLDDFGSDHLPVNCVVQVEK
jgi:endonuclease/exonuclease/phosphatase (EEP) superfamily protein YafD